MSGVIVLYYPKLGLPDTEDFQLFSKHHPFELYDSKYKTLFNFEKSYIVSERSATPLKELFFHCVINSLNSQSNCRKRTHLECRFGLFGASMPLMMETT